MSAADPRDTLATLASSYRTTLSRERGASGAGYRYEVRAIDDGPGRRPIVDGWCRGPRREAQQAAALAVLELRNAAAERIRRARVTATTDSDTTSTSGLRP